MGSFMQPPSRPEIEKKLTTIFEEIMMNKFLTQKILVTVLLVTSMLTPVAYAKGQTALDTPAKAASQNKADGQKRIATEAFVRTELFFGSDRPDDPDVSEADFRQFLDDYVTPEFPDGLTVLTGRGQFCCDAGGQIIQETSFVLILLYPLETQKASSEKIEKIREGYKDKFQQQSVLRVDDPRPVRVSF